MSVVGFWGARRHRRFFDTRRIFVIIVKVYRDTQPIIIHKGRSQALSLSDRVVYGYTFMRTTLALFMVGLCMLAAGCRLARNAIHHAAYQTMVATSEPEYHTYVQERPDRSGSPGRESTREYDPPQTAQPPVVAEPGTGFEPPQKSGGPGRLPVSPAASRTKAQGTFGIVEDETPVVGELGAPVARTSNDSPAVSEKPTPKSPAPLVTAPDFPVMPTEPTPTSPAPPISSTISNDLPIVQSTSPAIESKHQLPRSRAAAFGRPVALDAFNVVPTPSKLGSPSTPSVPTGPVLIINGTGPVSPSVPAARQP